MFTANKIIDYILDKENKLKNQPLTTPIGFNLATNFPIPALSDTLTTSLISL